MVSPNILTHVRPADRKTKVTHQLGTALSKERVKTSGLVEALERPVIGKVFDTLRGGDFTGNVLTDPGLKTELRNLRAAPDSPRRVQDRDRPSSLIKLCPLVHESSIGIDGLIVMCRFLGANLVGLRGSRPGRRIGTEPSSFKTSSPNQADSLGHSRSKRRSSPTESALTLTALSFRNCKRVAILAMAASSSAGWVACTLTSLRYSWVEQLNLIDKRFDLRTPEKEIDQDQKFR